MLRYILIPRLWQLAQIKCNFLLHLSSQQIQKAIGYTKLNLMLLLCLHKRLLKEAKTFKTFETALDSFKLAWHSKEQWTVVNAVEMCGFKKHSPSFQLKYFSICTHEMTWPAENIYLLCIYCVYIQCPEKVCEPFRIWWFSESLSVMWMQKVFLILGSLMVKFTKLAVAVTVGFETCSKHWSDCTDRSVSSSTISC